MELSAEVKKYIEKHPFESDRKVAKLFQVKRLDVTALKKNHNDELVENFFQKIERLLSDFLLSGKFVYINLFLTAAFVRIIYFFQLSQNTYLRIPILDAQYYIDWAKQILAEGIVGKTVFFTEPLYAYLLALFLKISSNGQLLMLILQIILGILLPFIVFGIARKVYNYPIAVLSAFITALYGPFIFYENLLLKTSLEVFSLSLFTLVLIGVITSTNKWRYLLTGIFLGIIVTLKGNALILLPLISVFVWFFIKEKVRIKISLISFFIIGFFLIILPITARNYLVGKDLVLTNYSIGMVIYQGNWWDGDGSLLQPPFIRPHPKYEEIDSYKMAQAYEKKSLKPSQVSSFWMKKTILEISQNPIRWVQLMGKKIILLITRVEMSDNYDYSYYKKVVPILRFLPDFWPIMALALTGILMFLFSRDFRLLLMEKRSDIVGNDLRRKLLITIVGGYSLLILAGHVNSRYRTPLIPLLIILGMSTVWYVVEKIKKQQFFKMCFIILTIFIFLYCGSIHLDNFDFITDANFYNNVGSYYLDLKNYPKALEYFNKAVKTDAKFYPGYSNLFNLYLINGEFALAKENLQQGFTLRTDDAGAYQSLKQLDELKDKPAGFIANRLKIEEQKAERNIDRYDPYFYEGMRALKQKDNTKAKDNFTKSLQEFHRPPMSLLNLAVIKKGQGNTEEAKFYLETLTTKNKYFIAAQYNLANIYIKEKKYDQAAKLLQEVYDQAPEFGETWFYLGAAYINSKQLDAALPIVTGFIKKYENDPAKKTQVEKFKSLLVGK